MLEAIRKRSASIIVKLLSGVLIMGFIAWGASDVITGRAASVTLATVGDVDIRPGQVSSEYRREVERLRSVFGGRFTSEQARVMGVPDRVVNTIVQRTLYQLGAEDLGVVISDNLLRTEIRKNAAFRNAMGQFDRNVFQQVIRNGGFTESLYTSLLREDLIRSQYLGTIMAGAIAPDSMVEAAYRHRREKRVAEILRITDSAVTDIAEPDDTDLSAFHKDNAARFTAPEFRTLTAVTMNTAELAKEISVSEDAIRDAYENRADEFSQPERRRMQQMLLKDEETAKRAHSRLSGGADFAQVAKDEAGAEKETLDLGSLTRAEVPLPELAEAAFALKDGAISEPIKSPLGWHIVRVLGIEPARIQTIEETRTALTADLAQEKAVDSMFALANQLEDLLGGGATLEEAAGQLSLRLVKIDTIDASGRDRYGKPVDEMPGGGTFLQSAFDTQEGSESTLMETGSDGYFILRVDGVTSPALKPLDEVRVEVISAWKDQQQSKAANKKAEEVLQRLKDGEDIVALAAGMGLEVTTTAPFERAAGPGKDNLPASLIAELFKVTPRQAAMARGSGGYVVARLKEIQDLNPAADTAGLKAVKEQMTQSVSSDLLAQLGSALRQRFPVSINRRALNQIN